MGCKTPNLEKSNNRGKNHEYKSLMEFHKIQVSRKVLFIYKMVFVDISADYSVAHMVGLWSVLTWTD